jgi:hypothetical protein
MEKMNINSNGKKSKAVPVTGRGRLWGSETSSLTRFLNNRLTDKDEVVSLTRQPPFIPGILLLLISVTGRVETRAIGLNVLRQLKNPMTS